MPVVVRKTDPKRAPSSSAETSSASPAINARREIPTALFIAAIAIVVLIVGAIAYRMFAPGETWDNSSEGAKPTASALSAPPPVTRSGGGTEMGKDAQSQEPVGLELPLDQPR